MGDCRRKYQVLDVMQIFDPMSVQRLVQWLHDTYQQLLKDCRKLLINIVVADCLFTASRMIRYCDSRMGTICCMMHPEP